MKKRLITGVFFILALVVLFISRLLTLYVFDLAIAGLAVMACVEIARALERSKKYTHIAIAGSIPAVMYIVFIIFKEKQFTWQYYVVGLLGVLVLYFFVIFLLTLILKKNTSEEMEKYGLKGVKPSVYAFEKAFNSLFLVFYPSILFMGIVALNHLAELPVMTGIKLDTDAFVLFTLLLAFVVTISTDTMAYLVGSSLRGPKLCPRISPNKTISGAVGGLFGGIISALSLYLIFTTNEAFMLTFGAIGASVWHIVLLGVLGSVITQAGDLIASALKRHARIKDYGTIFPGHGGVMDRVDGLIFNALFILIVMLIII